MMSVRILHAADFHLDSPFEALTPEAAAIRRREQRELLDKLAALCEEERVQLVLLSGDLLDSAASYFETQEVLVRAFSRISAQIFIAPGNHDYYCQKSPVRLREVPRERPRLHLAAHQRPGAPRAGLPRLGRGFQRSVQPAASPRLLGAGERPH